MNEMEIKLHDFEVEFIAERMHELNSGNICKNIEIKLCKALKQHKMNEIKLKVNDRVIAKCSVRKGHEGTIVSIGENPLLPIAVVFDDNVEWDFKENELVKVKRGDAE